MPKSSTLSEQYDDFINKHIKPELEYIVSNSTDRLRVEYTTQNSTVTVGNTTFYEEDVLSFGVVGVENKFEIIFEPSNGGYRIFTSTTYYGEEHTNNHNDYIEKEFYEFMVRQFVSDMEHLQTQSREVISGRKVIELTDTFKTEELIERFRGYKNRREFSQLSITNITESSPTESTITEKAALAESLNLIKSETQHITDALKETGAVSPGSGLMPNQESCYPKPPYFGREEYLVTINGLLGEKLKKFEDQISFKVKEFYTYSNIYVGPTRFEITDTAGNTMKVSYLGESKGWNLKVNKENLTFKCGQSQSRAFEIITRYIHDNVYSKKGGNSTRVKLESCDTFNKTDFLTSLKKIPNTKGYEYYFRGRLSGDVSKSPSPFNCSFKPIDAAAGFTITMLASLLTNTTTPAIGYSTNTSVTNANLNTTTSRPEQDDNIDKSHIAVIVGFALLIFGIGAVCAICCYVNRRTSNKKNIESRSASYKKFRSIDNNVNNKHLSTIKEENEQGAVAGEGTSSVTIEIETEPLLPNNNQPSAPTSGGIELNEVQVDVHAGLSTAPQHMQSDRSQSAQCSGAGSVIAGMLGSSTLFKKQVEANNKSQETPKSGEQLESELDNAMQTLEMLRNGLQSNQLIGAASKVAQATIELADKAKAVVSPSNEGANSLLQAIQVEGDAQQASR